MKGISHRPLADMHTDGVYFDRDELLLVGDDSLCQYGKSHPIISIIDNSVDAEPVEEMVIGHS